MDIRVGARKTSFSAELRLQEKNTDLLASRLQNSLQDQPRNLGDLWVFVVPEAAVDDELVDVAVVGAAAELIHRDFLVVEVGQHPVRIAGDVGIVEAVGAKNEWTC